MRDAPHDKCLDPSGAAGRDDRCAMDAEEAEFAEEMVVSMEMIMGRYRDDPAAGAVYSMKSIAPSSGAMIPRMRQFVQAARERHRQKGRCQQERDYGTRYGLNRIHERQSYINKVLMTRKMQMNCN